MDKNWDRTVRDYLGAYYNKEDSLKDLCGKVGVEWENLGGNSVAPKNRIDGLLDEIKLSRTYHMLLCEMTYRREVFLEARLHIHLYQEGIKLIEKWMEFYWQPPEEHLVDPEKSSAGAHLVFQTLQKVQKAYLQTNFSEYLKTTASTLQAQGEWQEAADLLEEFGNDLSDSAPISGLIRDIRRVQDDCRDIRIAIDEKKWGTAQSIFEKLESDVPSCLTYPEFGKIRTELEIPRNLLVDANKALVQTRWEEAIRKNDLLSEYKTYPSVQDLIEKLERPRQWLIKAQELVNAKDWQEVKKALAGLQPEYETYPGVPAIKELINHGEALYQQALGEMSNQPQQWEVATKTLIELEYALPGFLDTAKLLAAIKEALALIDKAKQQQQNQKWQAAQKSLAQAIELLPQHSEARHLLDQSNHFAELYKQASGLFDEAKYDEALAAYRELSKDALDYEDCREKIKILDGWEKLFADVLGYITAKEWGEAENQLQELNLQCPRGYRNTPGLLVDVQRVIAIRAALQSPLVEDNHLVWEQGDSPYAVLQANVVTPATSMIEMEKLYSSQPKRAMPAQVQSAWDQLCSTEQRLFVDAYLYRVPQAGAMFAFIETAMARDQQFPPADQLASEFAEAAPVALLHMGQREPAVEKWRARQREQPRSGAPAHALALYCLANACQAEIRQDFAAAISEWRRALAQFALALNDRNYWREWGRERGETYARAVLPNLVEELRQKIDADLSQRLSRRAEKFVDERRDDLAAYYRQLALDFKIEMEAMQFLKTQGGLSLESGRKVWFGPLLLDWEPALGSALARYCADLFKEDAAASLSEGKPIESPARRLRLYFSSLKYAAAWLDETSFRPENALEQLLHADCGECPKKACADPTCTRHQAPAASVRLCCPTCPNFNQRNPAYAQLPNSSQVLRLDALCLAVQACLKLAALRIDQDEENDSLQIVLASWRKAWELAQKCGWEAETRQEIRAAALAGAAKMKDASRPNRAIALLDYLYQQEAFQDGAVTAKLAEYLTDRGLDHANQENYRDALKDMERAYGLTRPVTDQARDNYAAVLIWVANDAIMDDRDEAQRLLDQADQLIQEGMRLRPDYAEYAATQQLLEFVRQRMEGQSELPSGGDALLELKTLLGSMDTEKDNVTVLIAQASDSRNAGKLAEALKVIENAWLLQPQRSDAQEELLMTLAQRMEQLETDHDLAQSEQLYVLWRERLSDHPKAAQRLNFSRWSPRLKRDLEQIGLIVHSSAQEFILPFEADNLGTVMVRLAVEEALLRVTALLPFPSLDDEAVLSNLLQITGDVMFYKACSFETGGLALAAYVPLLNLSTEYLELLVRSLPRYVDMAPAVPGQMGILRDHMRNAREVNQEKARDANLPLPDLGSVRTLVEKRGWRWEQANDTVAAFGPPGAGKEDGKLPSPWRVEVHPEGFEFSTDLGYLRVRGEPIDLYQRLLRLNADLGLGKLTLTGEARLQLAVELPLLNQAAFEMATQALAANAEPLRRDLAQS